MSFHLAPAPENAKCSVSISHMDAEVCGKPAVMVMRIDDAVYFECDDHIIPSDRARLAAMVDDVDDSPKVDDVDDSPKVPRNRSSHPYVLVRDGRIVGYAASKSKAVMDRAYRLHAVVMDNR